MAIDRVRYADCDRAQADAILAILNDAILRTTAIFESEPRPREAMGPWFDAKVAGAYPVIGAFDGDGALLGFGSYGPFRNWPAYRHTVEHSVYVRHDQRGRGVGRGLLRQVIARAEAQSYHALIGGIEAGNTASLALHRALGFAPCGTVREVGHKFGRWLDLTFVQLLLPSGRAPDSDAPPAVPA